MHVGGGPDIRGGETHAYWIVIEILYNVIYSGCGRRERDGRVWSIGKPVWQAQHPTEAPDSSPRAVPIPASGNLQDRHGQVSLKHTHTHNFIIKEDRGGVYHLCICVEYWAIVSDLTHFPTCVAVYLYPTVQPAKCANNRHDVTCIHTCMYGDAIATCSFNIAKHLKNAQFSWLWCCILNLWMESVH